MWQDNSWVGAVSGTGRFLRGRKKLFKLLGNVYRCRRGRYRGDPGGLGNQRGGGSCVQCALRTWRAVVKKSRGPEEKTLDGGGGEGINAAVVGRRSCLQKEGRTRRKGLKGGWCGKCNRRFEENVRWGRAREVKRATTGEGYGVGRRKGRAQSMKKKKTTTGGGGGARALESIQSRQRAPCRKRRSFGKNKPKLFSQTLGGGGGMGGVPNGKVSRSYSKTKRPTGRRPSISEATESLLGGFRGRKS